MVWVPLRKKAVLGVVIEVHGRAPEFDVRPILDLSARADGLEHNQIEFGLWLQRETGATLFGCLALMLPPGVSHSVTPWFELKSRAPGATRTQEQGAGLLKGNGAMSLDQLQQAVGSSLRTVSPIWSGPAMSRAGTSRRAASRRGSEPTVGGLPRTVPNQPE